MAERILRGIFKTNVTWATQRLNFPPTTSWLRVLRLRNKCIPSHALRRAAGKSLLGVDHGGCPQTKLIFRFASCADNGYRPYAGCKYVAYQSRVDKPNVLTLQLPVPNEGFPS